MGTVKVTETFHCNQINVTPLTKSRNIAAASPFESKQLSRMDQPVILKAVTFEKEGVQ